MTSPCPWGQCEHSPNAHGLDHCHACFCVKPPPPPPGAGHEDSFDRPLTLEEFQAGEPQELETIEATICTACSAYVQDREKHVARHERDLDTLANLVMTTSTLDRALTKALARVAHLEQLTNRLQEQIGALDRANAEIDRQADRKPEF